MMSRYEYHGGVWIDFENPTEEEVHAIAKEFPIGERIETELFSPTPSPLVADDTDVTFLAVHFPTHGAVDGEIRDQEIDFAVGDKVIITVRYEVVEPLHRLQKVLETQKLVSPHIGVTTDALLEILFLHLFTAVRDHASHVSERMTRIEHDMFNGLERTTIRRISNVSREFLHIEAALANQEESLERFLKTLSSKRLFGPSFSERAERINAERAQIARLVNTYRSVATEMRETNNALLSVRQNEVIKLLTVVSFIFLPLALIAKVFAMKVKTMPFVDDPNGFWIILGLMFAVGVLLTLFVVRKRWL